jgi:hypothetical protein
MAHSRHGEAADGNTVVSDGLRVQWLHVQWSSDK